MKGDQPTFQAYQGAGSPAFANDAELECAQIFDFHGIPWDYEPRTFVLEAFTPDFYLPEQDLYLEITTMKQSLVTKKNRKMRRLRELYPGEIVGLKDSSGDLEYAAALTRKLEGFAVFPSAEASLGRARELGFAGCVSATANITGPFAQRAWSGTGNDANEGLAQAVEIRAAIARFPLVAAVKASLALLTKEPNWRKVMPPLSPLSDDQLGALKRALSATALMAHQDLETADAANEQST